MFKKLIYEARRIIAVPLKKDEPKTKSKSAITPELRGLMKKAASLTSKAEKSPTDADPGERETQGLDYHRARQRNHSSAAEAHYDVIDHIKKNHGEKHPPGSALSNALDHAYLHGDIHGEGEQRHQAGAMASGGEP